MFAADGFNCDNDYFIFVCGYLKFVYALICSGPGCSKLMTPLVDVSLKKLISEICQYFSLKKCDKLLKCKNRKENPQKLTQLSSRSHPRHLVGKRTAQKDTIIDITSDSQVNSNFPYR